jgi:hypothetical protein
MFLRRWFWSAAMAAALPAMLLAQQPPTGFHTVYCVKVKPGMDAQFHAVMTGDLQKLGAYDVHSGRLSAWIALETVTPAGTEARCDYAFVEFYPGLPPAPMSDAESAADLRNAGVDKNDQQFTSELESTGTLVSTSIVRAVLQVGAAKQGDYIVVNDMKVPNRAAWIANEKSLWQPIFEDGVKDGAVDGWSLAEQFMPRGARDSFITYTVDIYPNWQSLFTFFGPNFPDRWKKIHPDVPIDKGMMDTTDTIEHTVLYKVDTAIQN